MSVRRDRRKRYRSGRRRQGSRHFHTSVKVSWCEVLAPSYPSFVAFGGKKIEMRYRRWVSGGSRCFGNRLRLLWGKPGTSRFQNELPLSAGWAVGQRTRFGPLGTRKRSR